MSHSGVVPLQSVLVAQPTHTLVIGLHTAVVPVQSEVFEVVHATQAPEPVSHAGVALRSAH